MSDDIPTMVIRPQPTNPAAPQPTNPITVTNIPVQDLINQPAIQQELLRRSQQLQVSQTATNYQTQVNNFLSSAEELGAKFNFRPNQLDQYASYTYHIKWSMISDRVATTITNPLSFANNTNISKTVIAESGVTAGFNIIDFELKNYCAPGPQVRSTQTTKFVMNVKEPYGFSLIDRIYSTAKLMGIANHLTSCYFIEIWFTGYNEDGTIGIPQQLFYKLYRVNMITMKTETTSSGTNYRIEGAVDGSYGHSDHSSMVPNAINIGPVKNIGEFFDKLGVALNDQQNQLEYDGTSRLEYVFNVPSWLRSFKFDQNPTSSARSQDLTSNNNQNEPTISIARGMDIETILYFVLSMSKDGQNWVAGEAQAGNASTTTTGASIRANGMANMLNIHAKQEIIGFDLITNDYVRKITYTFTPHPTSRAVIDGANIAKTQQPENMMNRLQTESQNYAKHYQYIYTGQNLDVLKFDIKLEWFYQIPIPSQLGDNTYSQMTQGPQYDQTSAGNALLQRYSRARQQKSSATSRIARAKSDLENSDIDAQAKTTAEQQLRQAEQDLATAESELKSINQATGGAGQRAFQVRYTNQSVGQSIEEGIALGQGVSLDNPTISKQIASQLLWRQAVQGRQNVYLEDVKIQNVEPRPLPISLRTLNEPTNQASNVGAPTDKTAASRQDGSGDVPVNRSLISTILNDVTGSTYFVEVELEIRGDPYWLSTGNVAETEYIINHDKPTDPDVAWYYAGDVGLVLSYRTGQAPNEINGYMEFDNGTFAFEGLYIAYEITNSFSQGKFTQTIKAVRNSLTNILPTAAEVSALWEQASNNIAGGAAL